MDAQSAMEAIEAILLAHDEGIINPIRSIVDIRSVVCEWKF